MNNYFILPLIYLLFNVSAQSTEISPQKQCVDAHLKLWSLTPWKENGNKKKRYLDKSRNYKKYKSLYQKEYYEFYNSKQINSQKKLRAEFEADAWVRCMRK